MKSKTWILLLIIAVVFAACQKDDLEVNKEKDQLKISQRFMELKQGFSLARNIVGQNASNPELFSLKSGSLKSASGDSTSNGSYGEYYETCAKITESKDEDGNTIVIMDYGTEGCDDYGILTKGKIITTYYNDDTSGPDKFKEEYVDFSFTYSCCMEIDSLGECVGDDNQEFTVTMNGTVKYEAEYDDDWNGSYFFEEDLTYTYSDGEEVVSKATYKEEQNEDSYTILEGEGLYTGADYEYKYKVVEPVVYKFTCGDDIYMPVSGIEKDSYKGKDENGEDESFEYEIDYGNGECDNKVKITENGVTEEIDFDDYYAEEDETEK